MWIQTGVTVRKRLSWVLTSVTLTFCMDIILVIGNKSWKFHDDTMMGTLSKRCHGRTDRQTEIATLKAAWSQLKKAGHRVFFQLMINDEFMKISVCQVSSYLRRPFLFSADFTIFNQTIVIIIPNIAIFRIIWKPHRMKVSSLSAIHSGVLVSGSGIQCLIHNRPVLVSVGNWYRRDLCLVTCEWLSFDSVNIDSKYFGSSFLLYLQYNFNAFVLMISSILNR